MTHAGFQVDHDQERRRVTVTLSTKSTVDVWRRAVSALVTENTWQMAVIYDMSSVETAPLLLNVPNLVAIVAELTKTYGRREAVAVIVLENELDLWRQRLSGVFGDLLAVEAFSDLVSAHAWLDAQRPPSQA
jgi:hypothetical protein